MQNLRIHRKIRHFCKLLTIQLLIDTCNLATINEVDTTAWQNNILPLRKPTMPNSNKHTTILCIVHVLF